MSAAKILHFEVVPFAAPYADGVIAVILPIQQSEFSIPITLDEQPDLRDIPTFYQEHRVREIFLGTTAKFLAAHRFYEKNGFREIARSELPESFPIVSVDTKFYCRVFFGAGDCI